MAYSRTCNMKQRAMVREYEKKKKRKKQGGKGDSRET